MQRHYSTAQREEMLSAVHRVVSLFHPEANATTKKSENTD
jgi:hypothetical protein